MDSILSGIKLYKPKVVLPACIFSCLYSKQVYLNLCRYYANAIEKEGYSGKRNYMFYISKKKGWGGLGLALSIINFQTTDFGHSYLWGQLVFEF